MYGVIMTTVYRYEPLNLMHHPAYRKSPSHAIKYTRSHLEKFFTEQLKSRDGHCPGELLHLGKDGRDFIKFQLTVCAPTNYAVLG